MRIRGKHPKQPNPNSGQLQNTPPDGAIPICRTRDHPAGSPQGGDQEPLLTDPQANLQSGRCRYAQRRSPYEGPAWAGPVLCIHLILGTAVWSWLLGGDGADLATAWYFAVVTFLTIGYGDITPAAGPAKVFFMMYVAGSAVVQLTVVASFVHTAVNFRERGGVVPEGSGGHAAVFYKMKPRLLMVCWGLLVMIVIISMGAAALCWTEDANVLDALYWSVSTLSTVGYGDITPRHCRFWYGCYFLLGVVTFTYILGEIVGIAIEVMRWRRLLHLFDGGLSEGLIDKMDYSHDGQVSEAEWLVFILQELQLVDKHELDNILEMFKAVDTNGDGVLDMDDVRRRSRTIERSGPGPSTSQAEDAV